MTTISNAIDELQLEIDAFNQGSKQQPKDQSTEWFLLRAKTLGVSYLKRIQALDIEADAGACERVYKLCLKTFKAAEVPVRVEVEKELVQG